MLNRLNKSKKSIIMKRLLNIIYVLGAAFVIFLVMSPLSSKVLSQTKEGVCKATVALKEASFGVLSEKCPPDFIRVSKSKITKDDKALPYEVKDEKGKRKSINYNFNTIPPEFLYKTIADEMVSCWERFGAGKDVFSHDFLKTSRNCALCAQISFDPDVKTEGIYGGLYDYVYNLPIKGKDQTYYQYLGLEAISTSDNVFKLTLKPTMDESELQGESFQYYTSSKWVFDSNTKLNPANPAGYTILYFVWSMPEALHYLNLVREEKVEVPAQVFLVRTDEISTYLCQNFMN